MALQTVFSNGERCCLAIDGEVTIYSVAELKAGFAGLTPDCAEIEIDLSGVTEMDTAGLQLMLMAKRIEGWSIRFVNHSEVVLHLLEVSNLAGVVGDPLVIAANQPRARAGGSK